MGKLYVLSAPSGCGKTTLVNAVLKSSEQVCISVSHTTRQPRPGEKEGIHYHFVSKKYFEQLINEKFFIEHAVVFNHYYGTSLHWIQAQLESENDVILEIDWQGAQQIKQHFSNAITIFLVPPSLQILKSRLSRRAQNNHQAMVTERMQQIQRDFSHYREYDYLILNQNFKNAVNDFCSIIRAHRLQQSMQSQQLMTIIKTFL